MNHAQEQLKERYGINFPERPLAAMKNAITHGEATCVHLCADPDRVIYEVPWDGGAIPVVWSIRTQLIVTVLPRDRSGQPTVAWAIKKKQTKKAFFRDLRRSGAEDCDDIEITGDDSYGVAS